MNLLDTIKQNSAIPTQGVTDESQKLQTLLRAKSGKAIGGAGIASSNLGEQQAVASTNQQIQTQVVPQQQIQQAGLEQQASDIQQQEQQQTADIAQSKRFDTIQTRLKTDQLLSDMERDKGRVDVLRDNARLEQLGQNLRLQTREYTDNLAREGAAARLNDDLAFKEATLRANMGNDMETMNKTIDNNTILNANDRDFEKKLGQMKITDAFSVFAATSKAANEKAMWGSIGEISKAGIGAAGSYMAKESDITASPSGTADNTVKGSMSSETGQSTTSGDSFIDYMGKNK